MTDTTNVTDATPVATEEVKPITETPVKITTDKPVKIKDPKKVAQGKKLAEISKAAKERKMRGKIEAEMHEGDWDIHWGYVVGAVELGVAAGAMYYGYSKKEKGVWNPPATIIVEKGKKKNNNLESFD